jgi:hypothetical protein
VESGESVVVNGSGEAAVAGPAVGMSDAPADPRRAYPMIFIAVLLSAVVTIWHAVVMLRGYFWQDDFLYVYRAATTPLFEYLFQGYNGHLMPGQFLLVWLVTGWAPLNWVTAVLPLVALQVLGYVLFWRLLIRLFGHRLEILLPFSVFVASPLVFVASSWWAYALQVVPFQAALAGALHAHVGYLRTGERRQAVTGLLWTIGGLLFWEKALLVVPVLFAVTVVFMKDGLVFRLAAAVGRYRRLWLGYAVAVAIYVAVYLRATSTGEGLSSAGGDNGGDILTLADRMLLDTFLPGILGVPWLALRSDLPPLRGVPPDAVVLGAGLLAVLIGVVGLWVGRTRALVAWGLLVGYLACEVALVAAFRLDFIGPIIGEDVRYIADAVPVAVLCAALAFLPPITSANPSPQPEVTRSTVATLGFGTVLTVAALVTIATVTPQLGPDAGREYVRTASKALRAEPDTVLYDAPVPEDLMIPAFGRDAWTSTVVVPLGLDVAFDKPTGDLRMLDETGAPRDVVLKDTFAAPPGPVPNCGYQANQFNADIAFGAEPPAGRQVVRLGYFTNRTAAGTVTVGNQRVRVIFQSGLHYLYLTVPRPSQVLSIDLAPNDTTLCVTDAVIGTPRPE